jgi:rsbT antagonist protein RsbS
MAEAMHLPIIKLYDTLIVSIQVELSDRVVMQLKDDVGERIQELGPRGLIIDVSGVEIMDSYISRAIRDIGLMAKLMGVETVISGLDPNIAMTLVEMGMDLEGVETFLDLETAFESIHLRASSEDAVLADIDDHIRWSQ